MYTLPQNVYTVDSATELLELVNANATTKVLYIKLTDDIDMSEVTGASDYFAEKFIGILDGQGYKITGLNKPLFKETQFTVVSDISFEGNSEALLSKGVLIPWYMIVRKKRRKKCLLVEL